MPFLAVVASSTPSAADRMKQIPFDFWWKAALALVAVVAVVILLRKVAKMNKFVLGVVVFLVCTFVGFNWIYERSEPAWATPVVHWLAQFLPSKGRA